MGINNLSRREFAKLTAAAVGGVVAGTAVNGIAGAEAGTIVDESPLLSGKNVCRGLNPKCGGHKGGSNTCAGQGSCHTANKHTCHGSNLAMPRRNNSCCRFQARVSRGNHYATRHAVFSRALNAF